MEWISALEQQLITALRLNAELREGVAAALVQITILTQENAYLRRQLGKNSGNSSKPPSSDGLKKKPTTQRSLRGKSGKKSGGQVGHNGGTLCRIETSDIVERHEAYRCSNCAEPLTSVMAVGVEKRQVFDIPEPRL